jgi:hypothetical protein
MDLKDARDLRALLKLILFMILQAIRAGRHKL